MVLPPVKKSNHGGPTCSPPKGPVLPLSTTFHRLLLQLNRCMRTAFPQVYETWKWSVDDSLFLPLLAIWFNCWQVGRQKPRSDCSLPVRLSSYTPSFPGPSFAAPPRVPLKVQCSHLTPAHFILHPSHTQLIIAPRRYNVLCWLPALYIVFSFWNILPVLHSNGSYSSIISHLRCHFLQGNLTWPSKTRLSAASLYHISTRY